MAIPMKILIFSDSHGHDELMRDAMAHFSGADCFIHLGDGTKEFLALRPDFPNTAFLPVLGNGEEMFSLRWKEEAVPISDAITLDGVRIFFTHGHHFDVKNDDRRLCYHALENGFDLALFGHTHSPYKAEYPRPNGGTLTIFNPGSIGRPRYGEKPSFGLLEIKNGRIVSLTSV